VVNLLIPTRLHWSLPVLLAFSLGYAASLTFEYVDGDDASSMAYHLLGRDPSVQPRYAGYQPGMDWILGFMRPVDPALRTVAMSLTAASALMFTFLLLVLAFDKNPEIDDRTKTIVGAALVFAAPELIYLGLLYTPMLVGMCFVLAGHVLLRRQIRSLGESAHALRKTLLICLAILLLLAGGFFRWDLWLYTGVVLLDISMDARGQLQVIQTKRTTSTIALSGAVLLGAIATVYLCTNANLSAAVMRVARAALATPRFPHGVAAFVGAQQTFFSPAMLLALVSGMIYLWRADRKRIFFPASVMILMLLWPLWFSPKEILLFVPVIVIVFSAGVNFLWNDMGKKHPVTMRGWLLVLFIAPWFVGIRVTYGDSAWGPGFEVRPFDRPYMDSTALQPTLGAGALVPTSEGPRPFFGHAYCLFGKTWREFVREQANEPKHIVSHAVTNGTPILIAQGTGAEIVVAAIEQSLYTRDPQIRALTTGPPEIRIFSSPSGDSLKVVRYPLFHSRRVDSTAQALRSWLQTDYVCVFGYTSTLRTLYLVSPNSLETLGKRSALLNLKILETDWRRRVEVEDRDWELKTAPL
jgi:hypothetical protein